MWILFAVGSAFFAGATSVLAKAGIKSVSSDFATAFRTGVVLIFSWLMVFVVGCQNALHHYPTGTGVPGPVRRRHRTVLAVLL